ncbi:hypothetical protein TCAL_16003 [Tigriopus californicus]|uniref:Sphingomyelin synthase-like domain-containing protein n=2 Tax=Tigriopus californicus TaxID=6832 RepID=A0A553PG12_TIGCA|nr:hypothetical protein TCAL_16003 [Tigriopus californicus]
MLPADDAKTHGGSYGSFTDLNEHDPESEVNPNPRGSSLPRGATQSQSGGKAKGKVPAEKHSNPHPANANDGRPRQRGTGDTNSRERSSVISSSGAYFQQTGASSVHDSCSSDDEAGRTNANGYVRRKSRHPKNSSVRIEVDGPVPASESANHTTVELEEIPCEPLKTLFSFVFLFLAWLATTTSLALTHERVPDIAPLPDIFLDNVQYQPWGLDASEIVIMIATMSAFALALFHQHRFIVFRRIFFLAGIHYFYRSVTFYVTVLPKADPTYTCAPKSEHLTFMVIAQRVLKLLGGMGLSINGRHVYCGDYIYSGHTMTLLMTYLVIQEYSPRRWFILRWISLATTVGGVITLLFARGHYSVDVIIAYWITTRLWWIYHTMADNQHVVHADNTTNRLTKFWWWYVFVYLEGNVRQPLPKGYSWPLPKQVQHVPALIWTKIRGGGEDSNTGAEDGNDAYPDNDPEAGRPSLGHAVSAEGRRGRGGEGGGAGGPGSSSTSAASLR